MVKSPLANDVDCLLCIERSISNWNCYNENA